MRQDIDRYMTEDVTPVTFAVRLRSHPKLAITAKAKMKTPSRPQRHMAARSSSPGTSPWTLSPVRLGANEAAGRELVADAARVAQRAESPEHTALFTGVPHRHVLDFLNDYSFHERSGDGDRRRLVDYIEKRTRTGALKQWNVGVVGNSRGETDPYDFGSGVKVRTVRRARMMAPDDDSAFDGVADIHTLTSRRDEKFDLTTRTGLTRVAATFWR